MNHFSSVGRRRISVVLCLPSLLFQAGARSPRYVEDATTRSIRRSEHGAARNGAQPAAYAPCYLTGTGRPCAGLLTTATPTVGDLKRAFKYLSWGGGEGRRKASLPCRKTSSPCEQYAATFVNPDARNFPDDMRLTTGTSLVLGGMRLRPKGEEEARYKVGYDLKEDERRFVYFVASPLPTPPTGIQVGAGKVALGWTLYRLDDGPTGEVVASLSSGRILRCDHPHDDTGNARIRLAESPSASFTTCPVAAIADSVGALIGASTLMVLNAFTCEAGRLNRSITDRPDECGVQLASKLAALNSSASARGPAVRSLLTRMGAMANALMDPYWFSCASGCCTADP